MDLGASIFPSPDAATPDTVARLVEEAGLSALYFPDHSHIPAEQRSLPPNGQPVPRKYTHLLDLFVAATAAALATRRIRIGSSVCLVIQRDAITTAKQVASIDVLSGGRFDFGVGAGWNREEMANHGTDARFRMRVLRERVEAMKAIWTQEEASYSGEYVAFDRIWSWPKPTQRPHPPILVGGNGPGVLDRVLAYGDGWIPNHRAGAELLDRLVEARERAERPLTLQVIGVPPDSAVLEAYERAKVDRVVCWLPSSGRSEVERAIEAFQRAAADVHGV